MQCHTEQLGANKEFILKLSSPNMFALFSMHPGAWSNTLVIQSVRHRGMILHSGLRSNPKEPMKLEEV